MTTKKTPKKLGSTKKTPKKVFKYHLELEMNDIVHKVDTNDIHQSLKDFKDGPTYPFPIKTRVIIKYSNGTLNREKAYFSTIDSKRLFENKVSLELLANQLTKELDA